MMWLLTFLRRSPHLFWPRFCFYFSQSISWLILTSLLRISFQILNFILVQTHLHGFQTSYQTTVKSSPKMTFTLTFFILALFVLNISSFFQSTFMLTFVVLSIFRYLRLVVNLIAYTTIKGFPRSSNPTFTSSDVSVVVPTVFKNPSEIMDCLRRIVYCSPLQIIVVTSNDLVPSVESEILKMNFNYKIQIIGVSKLNKRTQMVAALSQAGLKGSIVCFADDDVTWPSGFIESMLAPFENPLVGAAGPSQQVIRHDNCSMWNFLSICYLERRNFNTGATNRIDGAVSTLSGRTSFYRTSLVQNEQFYDFFLNALNHDDDKNLTRWVFDNDFQIVLQFDPSARIKTTLETSGKLYIRQCLRWIRGRFRGNIRVMKTTTYWYNKHLWSLYAIYIAQFQTPPFIIDPGLAALLYYGMSPYSSTARTIAMSCFALWVFFTKIVKIIPHFMRHPSDIQYIPAMILFSYFHGFLTIYGLCTLHSKGW